MPRSRSRSIESSTCARISRASTVCVISRMRSASVDLPWSMWAMIEKLRMSAWSMGRYSVEGAIDGETISPVTRSRASVAGQIAQLRRLGSSELGADQAAHLLGLGHAHCEYGA